MNEKEELSFEEKKVLLLEDLMSACKHNDDERLLELSDELDDMFIKE